MISSSQEPLVLFYTNTPRAFCTTLIGHLYEISQAYPVVLLAEELDPLVMGVINDKSLFPKLKKIIPVRQYTGGNKSVLVRNRELFRIAKEAISAYSPQIVVASSDWHSLFEMYLMRYGKKTNALRVTFQDTVGAKMADIKVSVDLYNAALRFPNWIPFFLRVKMNSARCWLAHIMCYWLFPLLNMEKPFYGTASYILHKGNSGIRDTDYHVVFSSRDKKAFMESGVPNSKICVLPHPLTRNTRGIFTRISCRGSGGDYPRSKKMVLVLFPAEEIGFRRADYSVIAGEQRMATAEEVFKVLANNLQDWEIVVKPHPLFKDCALLKKRLSAISHRIEVVAPTESPDGYVDSSDFILELPRPTSTVLYTTALKCPGKTIVALDLHNEFVGDYYRDFPGIIYLNRIESFVEIVEKVNRGEAVSENEAKKLQRDSDYSDASELIGNLYAQKQSAQPS